MSYKKDGVFTKLYNAPYGNAGIFQLFDATKNSKSFVQRLRLQVKIPAHNGCVNSVCWSETGKYLLSGSDDQHICVTHAYTHSILAYIATGHRSNIFSAKFMPGANDSKVISCSGDGIIIYSDLDNSESSMVNKFGCHFGTTYEIMTVPNDPNTFLSCGEDGTVRWFDLRTKTSCENEDCKEDILIDCHSAVTALSVNPVAPYQLAVGCSDASVRIYDRRMLGTAATGNYTSNTSRATMANFTVPEFTSNHRITSLGYSRDGYQMLVSYSSDFVYLFDIRNGGDKDPKVLGSCNKPKNTKKTITRTPLMKRLRVRGDWSDTGPNARPESENSAGEQQPRTLHASLMQRMSDVLTTMYNNRTRPSNQNESVSHSEGSEMDDNEVNEAAGVSGWFSDQGPLPTVIDVEDSSESQEQHRVLPSTSGSGTASINTIELTGNGESSNENEDAIAQPLLASGLSHNTVDLPFTMIKVSSAPVNDISSESQNNPDNSRALNLSLQNIRQELSQRNAGGESRTTVTENPPVIFIDDDEIPVIDLSSANEDSNEPSNLATESMSHSSTESCANPCLNSRSSSNVESNAVICDNESCEASGITISEVRTVSCDSSNVMSNPTTVEDATANSSSNSEPTGLHVPNIYIANVPTTQAEVSSSVQEQQQPSEQGEISFMMEMDPWDMDSEEDSRSSFPSSQRSGNIQSDVMSAFDADKSEDMESDESYDSYTLSPTVHRKYAGHRNARTMIKEANFWGDNFIMSGSDCGHIFIWDRHTTELVMLMEADHHVVNCLQPHPFDPILASSGIDYDIKIWAPLREEPLFDEEKADEIIKRNRVMLEETKDTITVPATFMIRMLASLNHITSGSGWRRVARQLRDGSRNRNNR